MAAGLSFDVPNIDIDISGMLREIASAVVSDAQLNFIGSHSPTGEPWPKLADSTIARRRNGSDKPLRDTGRLMNSLLVGDPYDTAEGKGIDAGSNVIYSRIHNQGGQAGRGLRTTIPMRKFLADDENIGEDLATELMGIAARYIANGVER